MTNRTAEELQEDAAEVATSVQRAYDHEVKMGGKEHADSLVKCLERECKICPYTLIAELSATLKMNGWNPIEEIQFTTLFQGDIFWLFANDIVVKAHFCDGSWYHWSSESAEVTNITQFKPYVPTPPKKES